GSKNSGKQTAGKRRRHPHSTSKHGDIGNGRLGKLVTFVDKDDVGIRIAAVACFLVNVTFGRFVVEEGILRVHSHGGKFQLFSVTGRKRPRGHFHVAALRQQ